MLGLAGKYLSGIVKAQIMATVTPLGKSLIFGQGFCLHGGCEYANQI